MHDSKFSAMQEAYDSRSQEEYDDYQTEEEMDLEAEQESTYNAIIKDAFDMDYSATEAFIEFMEQIKRGEAEEAEELLMFMLSQAADYAGSEAEVPDFVRLVRMAFKWKSKQ